MSDDCSINQHSPFDKPISTHSSAAVVLSEWRTSLNQLLQHSCRHIRSPYPTWQSGQGDPGSFRFREFQAISNCCLVSTAVTIAILSDILQESSRIDQNLCLIDENFTPLRVLDFDVPPALAFVPARTTHSTVELNVLEDAISLCSLLVVVKDLFGSRIHAGPLGISLPRICVAVGRNIARAPAKTEC